MKDFDTEVGNIGRRRFRQFVLGRLARLAFWLVIGAALVKVLKP